MVFNGYDYGPYFSTVWLSGAVLFLGLGIGFFFDKWDVALLGAILILLYAPFGLAFVWTAYREEKSHE